jgi:hypothetical protein
MRDASRRDPRRGPWSEVSRRGVSPGEPWASRRSALDGRRRLRLLCRPQGRRCRVVVVKHRLRFRPSQNRTSGFPASGSSLALAARRQLVVHVAGVHRGSGSASGRCLLVDVASVAPFPPRGYPASSVLGRDPTSPTSFASLGSSPRRAYPGRRCRRLQETSEISKVAIPSDCQTRTDLRPRAPMKVWPLTTFMMLPSGDCDHLGALHQEHSFGARSHSRPGSYPGPFDLVCFLAQASTTSSSTAPLGSIRGALARAYLGGIRPRLMS